VQRPAIDSVCKDCQFWPLPGLVAARQAMDAAREKATDDLMAMLMKRRRSQGMNALADLGEQMGADSTSWRTDSP
jgi:hypothetical protein